MANGQAFADKTATCLRAAAATKATMGLLYQSSAGGGKCKSFCSSGRHARWRPCLFAALMVTLAFSICVNIENVRSTYALLPSDIKQESNENNQRKMTFLPRYIFGHSAGHTGSTTSHSLLLNNATNCLWTPRGSGVENGIQIGFEKVFPYEVSPADAEKKWRASQNDENCNVTRTKLIPFLEELTPHYDEMIRERNNHAHEHNNASGAPWKKFGTTTYLDMGHHRNRGNCLECLARHTRPGEAVFVHLRRNRYDVANSYLRLFNTTCTVAKDGPQPRPPVGAVCPHSAEGMGDVNLPVSSDDVWGSMTPFQKFLWYADEMERRWYTLKQEHEARGAGLLEVTWSTADELREGLRRVQLRLGCEVPRNVSSTVMGHMKRHVEHKIGVLNCSDFVRQDLEYRRLMNYGKEDHAILFERHPQRLDSKDCMDSHEDLEKAIEAGGGGGEWVLPPKVRR